MPVGYCGEKCLATSGDITRRAITQRCRSWGCEECQPRRKRRLVALAAGGQPNMMITLTTRFQRDVDPADEARRQAKQLAELKRRIKRKFKVEKVEWLVVREKHKTGWPHMHVLARLRYIPQKWLSSQWLSISKSSRVFVQRLKSTKHAANYVSKYIGKAPAQLGTAKRYWKTKAYDLRQKLEDKVIMDHDEYWHTDDRSFYKWQHDQICRGWRLKETRNETVVYTWPHLIL